MAVALRSWDFDDATDAVAPTIGLGMAGVFAHFQAEHVVSQIVDRARGAFVGLQVRHDRGALVRAVLEGVAFGLRDSFDLLVELGVEATAARASGGGARSRLWLRIVASVLGVPLELTESEEGSAFGAALLGGVAAGVFADVHEAVDRCVRVRDTVEPEPGWHETYAGLQDRYRALYPSLKVAR